MAGQVAVESSSARGPVDRDRKRVGKALAMKFAIGRIVVTPAASQLLDECHRTVEQLLDRHRAGDWGDIDADGWRLNDQSLDQDMNLMSIYELAEGKRISVFTHADRSLTIIHLAPVGVHAPDGAPVA